MIFQGAFIAIFLSKLPILWLGYIILTWMMYFEMSSILESMENYEISSYANNNYETIY